MKKLIYISLFIVLFGFKQSDAQDIHFSQLYLMPMVLNPANAGAVYQQRATLLYRNQWSSVTTPYVSMKAGYDRKFKSRNINSGYWAAGMYIYNDKAGDSEMSLTEAVFSGAYHLPLSKYNLLGVGIQGGYFQKSANASSLTWANQFDGFEYNPNLSSNESFSDGTIAFGKLDASVGIVHTYQQESTLHPVLQRITSGIAVHHLNKPSLETPNSIINDKLYYRWAIHTEAVINMSEKWQALPNVAYYYQGKLQEIYFGSAFMYQLQSASLRTNSVKPISMGLGANYRWKDAIAATLLFDYNNFLVGFAYDLNISTLKNASNMKGGFEIGLRWIFESEKIKAKSRFN
ncbi:MAG: hypothetical protein Kow0079_08280 [Vicingaceae bacterium]